ncbi:20156_t:CDS:2 [Entrophospora sp. SA101]|nr:20156_t:CDS:2 [Entrophospora sp. SA101]
MRHTCSSKPAKYISVTRKKSERAKLKATDCIECRDVSNDDADGQFKKPLNRV